MNLSKYIDDINEEISKSELKREFLMKNLQEITGLSQSYFESYMKAYEQNSVEELLKSPEGQSFVSLMSENIIYKDIEEITKKIIKLRNDRDSYIANLLRVSVLSVDEVIKLLDVYSIYYKAISLGSKTLIAPQDFHFINKVEDGPVIDAIAANSTQQAQDSTALYRQDIDWLATLNLALGEMVNTDSVSTPEPPAHDLFSIIKRHIKSKEEVKPVVKVPVLINTEEGIKLNPQILDINSKEDLMKASENLRLRIKEGQLNYVYKTTLNNQIEAISHGLIVEDTQAVRILLPSLNGVRLNAQILNIFPDEVLSMLLDYIEEKLNNPTLSVVEYATKSLKK